MFALFLAAIIPTIVLLRFIIRHDKIEKEPPKLLIKIFILGMLSTITAVIFGELLGALWEGFDGPNHGLAFLIFDNFIAVALCEEGGKLFVTKRATWKNPNFNYTFDAVVYCVCASLGFATLENILYVMTDGGWYVAIMRALMSVPGHTYFAVFMGAFYGLAKEADSRGDRRKSKHYMRLALIVPMLIHGFYDFCIETEDDLMILVLFGLLLVVTILAIREVRKLSKEDHPLPMRYGSN